MKIRLVYICLIFLFVNLSNSQIKRDPRMIGLGKAYSTIVNDYRCVGINPANLAFNKSLKINLLGSNFHFLNNIFSIETYNGLNGASLYDVNAEKYFEKNDIFRLSKKKGLKLFISLKGCLVFVFMIRIYGKFI